MAKFSWPCGIPREIVGHFFYKIGNVLPEMRSSLIRIYVCVHEVQISQLVRIFQLKILVVLKVKGAKSFN